MSWPNRIENTKITRILTRFDILWIEMLLTCEYISFIDLTLEIFVDNSCFGQLIQPLFAPFFILGISQRGQLKYADSFRSTTCTATKHGTVVARHCNFEFRYLNKLSRWTELHHDALETDQTTYTSLLAPRHLECVCTVTLGWLR